MTFADTQAVAAPARCVALVLLLAMVVLSPPLRADSVEQINAGTQKALQALRRHVKDADKLLGKAAGVLVFPDIVKLGFGVGGEFGEGVMLIDGKPAAYYATSGASFGLQLGAQIKSEVIVFRTAEALAHFRKSRGWSVGIDGSVAIFDAGAGATLTSRAVKDPVVAFIFSNEGLMANLTLEGAKITRLAR
jgi:lipid-binding SYLF domain-containing protein